MDKLTQEPTLHVRFTGDFMAVQVDGDLEDPSSFGLTLMTALRSLTSGADAIDLGEVKIMRGFNGLEGFQLMLDESGHNLKKYPGISQWSDLDAVAFSGQHYPVLPAAEDVTGWVDQLTGVRWRGLRSQSSDEWSHCFPDNSLTEDLVAPIGLASLQLDLLIRSLHLPRRQLQIVYGQHILWMAVNADSDFLLVLTSDALSPGGRSTLERCLSFFCWPL